MFTDAAEWNRRQFLYRLGYGLGGLAFTAMLLRPLSRWLDLQLNLLSQKRQRPQLRRSHRRRLRKSQPRPGQAGRPRKLERNLIVS